MKTILLCISVYLLAACSGKKQHDAPGTPLPADSSEQVAVINIQLSDTAFKKVETLLEMDRYIMLAQEPALANIKRVIIHQDRIYLLDNLPQIVCYDFKGNVQYHIASRGAGPKEFLRIQDFCIDPATRTLIAFDIQKGSLIRYDLRTGAYRNETPTPLYPMNVAFAHNRFIYDNAHHLNFPDRKDMHYFLLYTSDGKEVEKRFFPHDAVAEYDHGLGYGHPFFYNNDRLFYNNRFDNKVYAVGPDGPRLLYEINLPDPVPLSEIERKPDPLKLIHSDYSCGLTNIFQCGDLLYFWFTKKGFYQATFYNLKENKIVYCGKQVNNYPTEKLLFYSSIQGVYKDRFFSLVEPETIIYKKEQNPDIFPNDLKNINEMDNPVIAFYKVVE